jgi:hypothetical protein
MRCKTIECMLMRADGVHLTARDEQFGASVNRDCPLIRGQTCGLQIMLIG